MEGEDFRVLIRVLAQQLQEIGAGDIADDRHYTENSPEMGARRVVPPRDQLVLMLQAFERFLAVRDRATYTDALGRINQNVRGDVPRSVFYEPTLGSRDRKPISTS